MNWKVLSGRGGETHKDDSPGDSNSVFVSSDANNLSSNPRRNPQILPFQHFRRLVFAWLEISVWCKVAGNLLFLILLLALELK
jgi:hypothetical protein